VDTVSANDTASMKIWAQIITRRRLKLSAMAPPMSASSTKGSVAEAWTSATRSTASAIEVISQAAPTPWIRPPRLEAILAVQIERKTS
jgi:hypothetical protein